MFPLFYFYFIHISFFFSPLFFSSTHVPLLFFSLFPSFLFFPTTSSTHVPLLVFFISFFRLFPYHFTLQNVLHRARLFLPLSFSIFFLPFFLSPFSLTTLSASFFPSIPSKHTNFLGVLLIKTLPSKCISQIRLDINKIF